MLEGTVRDGTIVLDQSELLPEGARVEVFVKEKPAVWKQQTLREVLLSSAGCLTDLPADFAEKRHAD
jgi:hypothetical protein